MPSVSKSKTRNSNKKTSGAVKEQLKDVVKHAVSTSGGNGTSAATAENHTVGTVPQLENAVQCHGFSGTVDECDTHSGSSGTGPEYDSVSNNGSYSGESEDLKEKTVSNIIDAEKREKIRLRNEKKHQRQRERRAQELHERCCSLLMSRKIESLSRQLVAMGFTTERADAALMMNDGKLEESVVWLLEGNMEASMKNTNQPGERAMKVDIANELAQIEAMETRYNCSKKDVERAVVSSEGDLQKAEEVIRIQKQELSLSSSRSEGSNNNSTVPQLEKSVGLDPIKQSKSERDPNYPNAVHLGVTNLESVSKFQQLSQNRHVNGVSDGLWQPLSSNLPRNTYAPSTFVLSRPSTNAVDAQLNNTRHVATQQTGVREPLVVMQRPNNISTMQVPQTTSISAPRNVAGLYPNSTAGHESLIPGIGARNVHQQQTNYQADYRHQDAAANLSETSRRQLVNSGSRNGMSPSCPPLNVPSSLGLFSTRTNGHSRSSSTHVDWNHVDWYAAGQMPLCDYTSTDWTMDSNPLSKSKSQWDSLGLSSIWKNQNHHNPNGDAMSGFSRRLMSHEWTSPFGGNDMFSAPKQFLNSSSLW